MILYVLKIFCCKVLRTDTFEYYAIAKAVLEEVKGRVDLV